MDPAELDEIQRAVRFFYIVKTSFAGKWHDASFGYAKTGIPGLNLESLYETFAGIHKRLRHVYIEEGTFEKTIERYDGADTVFFLDPPYYGLAGYSHKMDPEDYERLRDILTGIAGKFILTINDHDVTRELFSGFIIEEVEVPYSIARCEDSRTRYGELMIRNYEIEGLLL